MYIYPPEIRKFILDNPVTYNWNYIAKDVPDDVLEMFVGEDLSRKNLWEDFWRSRGGPEWPGHYDFSQVQTRADAIRQRLEERGTEDEEGNEEGP